MAKAVVQEAVVRFVVDQPGFARRAPVHDANELLRIDNGARRIVGRVEDHAADLAGDRAFQRGGRRPPAGGQIRRHERWTGPGQPHHFRKRNPVGGKEGDVVSLLEEGFAHVEDGLLRPGRHDHVLAGDRSRLLPDVLGRDRVAQRRVPRHVRVLGAPRLDRPHTRAPHECGRREIGLSDREIHHVHARGREGLRLLPSRRR